MDRYKLQLDKAAGLQVVRDDAGVEFEALGEQVTALPGLSEFEQFRFQKILRQSVRRPKTHITNINHLLKEPFFSAGSRPEDDVQFRIEIYDINRKSAEVVLEYPSEKANQNWSRIIRSGSLSNEQDVSESSIGINLGTQVSATDDSGTSHATVTRLTFELGSDEISSLLKLCRILPNLSS